MSEQEESAPLHKETSFQDTILELMVANENLEKIETKLEVIGTGIIDIGANITLAATVIEDQAEVAQEINGVKTLDKWLKNVKKSLDSIQTLLKKQDKYILVEQKESAEEAKKESAEVTKTPADTKAVPEQTTALALVTSSVTSLTTSMDKLGKEVEAEYSMVSSDPALPPAGAAVTQDGKAEDQAVPEQTTALAVIAKPIAEPTEEPPLITDLQVIEGLLIPINDNVKQIRNLLIDAAESTEAGNLTKLEDKAEKGKDGKDPKESRMQRWARIGKENAEGALDSVMGVVSTFVNIAKKFGGFFMLAKGIVGMIDGWSEGFAKGGIPDAIKSAVIGFVDGAVGWLFNTVIGGMQEIYSMLGWDDAAKSLEGVNLKTVLTDVIDSVGNFLGDRFYATFVEPIQNLMFAFQDMMNGLTRIADRVKGWFTKDGTFSKDLEAFGEWLWNLPKMLGKWLIESLPNFLQKLVPQSMMDALGAKTEEQKSTEASNKKKQTYLDKTVGKGAKSGTPAQLVSAAGIIAAKTDDAQKEAFISATAANGLFTVEQLETVKQGLAGGLTPAKAAALVKLDAPTPPEVKALEQTQSTSAPAAIASEAPITPALVASPSFISPTSDAAQPVASGLVASTTTTKNLVTDAPAEGIGSSTGADIQAYAADTANANEEVAAATSQTMLAPNTSNNNSKTNISTTSNSMVVHNTNLPDATNSMIYAGRSFA